MDVNPIKPVPVVQPPRKVDREPREQEREKDRNHREEVEQEDDGTTGIDTYA